MKPLSAAALKLVAIVLAVVVALTWLRDRGGLMAENRRLAKALTSEKRAVTKWKRWYGEAAAHVAHDIVPVVKYTTKFTTLYADTGRRVTDTVWVKEALATADTAIRACTELKNDCARLRFFADSVIAHQDSVGVLEAKNQRRWRDRFGVHLGYGLLFDRAGDVRHGVTISASVKVWP